MSFFAMSAQHIWLNLQFSPVVFFSSRHIFILVSNAEKLGLDSPPARKYKIWKTIVLNSLSLLLSLSLPASYFFFFFASLFPPHFPLPSYSLSFLFPSCSFPSLAASHFIVPTFLAQFLLTFLPPSPPSFLLLLFFPIFLLSYLSSSHPPSPLSFLYSILSSFLLNVLQSLPPFPFLSFFSWHRWLVTNCFLFFADQGYRYVRVTWAWWVNRVSKIASTR